MQPRTIISVILGLILLAGALVYAMQPLEEAAPSEAANRSIVQVAPVVEAMVTRKARFSAITRSSRQATLSFSLAARMDKRPVEVGDRVEKGQLLAVLELRQFDNGVASAEAAVEELTIRLAQAGRDRRRYEELNRSKAAPTSRSEQATSEHLQLQAALAGARAQEAEARRRRGDAELRAPFAGTVTAVHLEPGEWADPGRPAIELVDTETMELEVEIPETLIGQLESGQEVDVRLPFVDDTPVKGRITHLARAAKSAGRLFPVLIALGQKEQLAPGQTAELVIDVDSHSTLLVPVSSVINPGGSRPSLFILRGERVQEVPVELEGFHDDQVMVTGNLMTGDLVVISGQTTLMDGKKVEVGS